VFVAGSGSTLTLRWSAAGTEVRFPFAALNRARNWQEFRNALSDFPGPAQNFVYADREGHIGYQAAGRLPVRPPANRGDVPVDGATGNTEWDGFIPFDTLPTAVDPPSAMIVTANQNPFPPAYRFPVAGKFASHYRSSQIHALLESRKQWNVDAMLQVQTDVYSSVLHYIASRVVAVASSRQGSDPAVDSVIAALKSWNGQMSAEGGAPLAASLVLQHLRRGLADLASPGKGLEYDAEIAPAVIERILREQPEGWFDDYDQWLMGALVDAIEEGKRLYGRDPARWRYGDTQPLVLPHPVLSRLPWIGAYFRLGPVPHSGSPTTVKQMTRRLGPSMRMVLDTADWDKSLANITVGQSGHPLSGNFRDQWGAYLSGRSFPMQFQKVEAVDVLKLIPGGP
jgi:penicillin amidase